MGVLGLSYKPMQHQSRDFPEVLAWEMSWVITALEPLRKKHRGGPLVGIVAGELRGSPPCPALSRAPDCFHLHFILPCHEDMCLNGW